MQPDETKKINKDLSVQQHVDNNILINAAIVSQRNEIRIKIKELQEQLREITGIGLDQQDKML